MKKILFSTLLAASLLAGGCSKSSENGSVVATATPKPKSEGEVAKEDAATAKPKIDAGRPLKTQPMTDAPVSPTSSSVSTPGH